MIDNIWIISAKLATQDPNSNPQIQLLNPSDSKPPLYPQKGSDSFPLILLNFFRFFMGLLGVFQAISGEPEILT